ncbi:MAG: DUF350 domain-containing protein [Planctomycetota bacterium]|nr:DUF350 domain-containing protein [Planctomycetota bacterium]
MLALLDLNVEEQLINPLIETLVIGAVAILMLFLSVWLMEKLSPFSLRKEIEDDHNTSVAIVVGAIVIGVALVIASVARA